MEPEGLVEVLSISCDFNNSDHYNNINERNDGDNFNNCSSSSSNHNNNNNNNNNNYNKNNNNNNNNNHNNNNISTDSKCDEKIEKKEDLKHKQICSNFSSSSSPTLILSSSTSSTSSSSSSSFNECSSSQFLMKKVPRNTLAPLDDEILLKRCTHPLTTYFTGALLDFAEWDDPLRDSYVWSSKFIHLIR